MNKLSLLYKTGFLRLTKNKIEKWYRMHDIDKLIFAFGRIENVTFSKPLNYGIDTTLRKLFLEMPIWKSAIQAREKTQQRFVIKLIIGRNKYWEKNYG